MLQWIHVQIISCFFRDYLKVLNGFNSLTPLGNQNLRMGHIIPGVVYTCTRISFYPREPTTTI